MICLMHLEEKQQYLAKLHKINTTIQQERKKVGVFLKKRFWLFPSLMAARVDIFHKVISLYKAQSSRRIYPDSGLELSNIGETRLLVSNTNYELA